MKKNSFQFMKIRSTHWVHLMLMGAALVLLALGRTLLVGQDTAKTARPTDPPHQPGTVLGEPPPTLTPDSQHMVINGLDFLAKQQQPDGSIGSGKYKANVGVSAVCGLAFLAQGSLPGQGRFGTHLEKLTHFLLAHAQPNGFLVNPKATTHGPMYDHGFATLYLTQIYGSTRNPNVKPTLKKALQLIRNSQNKQGGWRYEPHPVDQADVSVTVSVLVALRAGRNIGFDVPKSAINRCVQFLLSAQRRDGGFAYFGRPGDASAFPRSAACVVALYNAGVSDSNDVKRGLDYLHAFSPKPNQKMETHFFYGHYYAIQAMYQVGGKRWKNWYPAIRDDLVRRYNAKHEKGGPWTDEICPEYATAMACIILQMPNRLLPIFQR